MNQHIVVVNAPLQDPELYFERFCRQLRANKAKARTPVVFINDDFPLGLPQALEDQGAFLVQGRATRREHLIQANVVEAEHIVLLAREDMPEESDNLNFDLCYRLKEMGLAYRILVECVDDENRERFKGLGVRSVMRPIRSYPEVLVRTLEAPGAEQIVEDLLTRSNDILMRFPLWLEGDLWRDVVQAMMNANLGTPLAWVSKDGELHIHPPGNASVYAQSIILLARSDAMPREEQVVEALRVFESQQRSA